MERNDLGQMCFTQEGQAAGRIGSEEDRDRIPVARPDRRVDATEQGAGTRRPGPPPVVGEVTEAFEAGRQIEVVPREGRDRYGSAHGREDDTDDPDEPQPISCAAAQPLTAAPRLTGRSDTVHVVTRRGTLSAP